MSPESTAGHTAGRGRTSSSDRFSDGLRPLFVGGCQRSGTTAFADYLNEHQEIMVCQERYKRIPRHRINPGLFTFERILDYRPKETNKPWNLEYYTKRHADIIARKDPAKLRWIGDKNPGHVKTMGVLLENNPGARFVMLYRPIEEVAESWEARAKNPDDHWLGGKDGLALAVEAWNTAMRRMREFVESGDLPCVLILSYGDFFYRNEKCVPLISRFLDLRFDDAVLGAWGAMSQEFAAHRRPKEPFAPEQEAFIREHADREAEAWVLDRIERQWTEPGLYARDRATTSALDEAEARAWKMSRIAEGLKDDLARERRELKSMRRKNRDLSEELRVVWGSRTLRLLDGLNRARSKIFGSATSKAG